MLPATHQNTSHANTLPLHDALPIYYWLNSPAQQVIENPGEGTDTIRIWQSYVLPANVENLIVFGAGNYAVGNRDRKSTRLNSSHVSSSYAVFCMKKITARKLSIKRR